MFRHLLYGSTYGEYIDMRPVRWIVSAPNTQQFQKSYLSFMIPFHDPQFFLRSIKLASELEFTNFCSLKVVLRVSIQLWYEPQPIELVIESTSLIFVALVCWLNPILAYSLQNKLLPYNPPVLESKITIKNKEIKLPSSLKSENKIST